MKRDAYEVLGVGRDAGDQEIKKAFRALARRLHPDVNSDQHAEENFKEAAAAYEVLSDPERRQVYDRYGWEGISSRGYSSSAQGFGSFADIFDAFFGGDPIGASFFGGGGRGAAAGGDLAVAVEVSLEEAAWGTTRAVEIDVVEPCERCSGVGAEPGSEVDTCRRCGGSGELRTVSRTAFGQLVRSTACDACGGTGKLIRTPCRDCDGRGRQAARRSLTIDIPAGISDEQRIRLSGRGHAGESGGPPGDLYVLVSVTEDERFVRDGNDLVSVLDLSVAQASLGTVVQVSTLDGERDLEVPVGTQPGTVLTLRGIGMPSLRGGRRGDHRVVLNVVVPRNLNPEQRDLVQQLGETLTDENHRDAANGSLLGRLKRALS
jgi:molecular chaperone DnaJ